MKKLLLIFIHALTFSCDTSAQLKVGIGPQLVDGLVGIQTKVLQRLDERTDGQASLAYYFHTSNRPIWSLDIDVLFQRRNSALSTRPFCGLNFIGGSATGYNSVGVHLNLGINSVIPLSAEQAIYIEPKIVLGFIGVGFGLAGGIYF